MSRLHSAVLAGALAALVGCGGSGTKPGSNSGSTTAGTNAGSGSTTTTASTGASSGSTASSSSGSTSGSTASSASSTGSSGSSTSTSTSGSGSGSGSTGSSGSSGTTGVAQPSLSGTLTWNTSALTHPAWVAVFDQTPGANVAPLAFVESDPLGNYAITVPDGGSYYVVGVYAPGATALNDGGAPFPLGPDGGLAAGYVAQGILGAFPGTLVGTSSIDADLSEMQAGAISLTINTSFLPDDAGFDGGAFPLLGGTILSGTDPITGQPVEDINLATVTLPDGTPYSLGLDTTNHDYIHAIDVNNVAGWAVAQDGTYQFSAQGSTVLGLSGSAVLHRQIDVHPLTTTPTITGPAPGNYSVASNGLHVQVSWVDAQGIDPANTEVKVTDLASGTTAPLCDIKPATTPTSTGLNQAGCTGGYTLGHSYKIELYDSRVIGQAEGYSLEAAYAAVYITYQ
ncbi:MAG: hypothetical protein JST54_09300 [Deltaproteobacteria bacterium]|nr:hypothetical protein [Deltaproteobacteria bacterium]